MGEELLTIVRTEEQAESLLAQAEEEAKRRIDQAHKRREERINNLIAPIVAPVQVRKPKADTEKIKAAGARNRQKAVAKILEAFHAST